LNRQLLLVVRREEYSKIRISGATMSTHKDLIVWQKAVSLATEVYAATGALPHDERYGLTSQMRRAAISVPSNIAEGAGRSSRAEYLHYLSIARGSLAELETQLQIARKLHLMDSHLESQLAEVGRLLTGLMQRLREQRLHAGSRAFG
jgi:four helix bundle protein